MRDAIPSLARRATILMALVSGLAGPGAAQSTDELQQAHDITRFAVDQVSSALRQRSPPALRALAASVELSLNHEPFPNAYAMTSREGRRFIAISSHLTLLFYYFSELNTLNFSRGGGLTACLAEYSADVRSRYARLRTAMMTGRTPQPIVAPERLAPSSTSCRQLAAIYPLPEEVRQARDRDVIRAVAFVYLHELGHHARGHNVPGEPDLARMPDDLTRQRAFLGYMCRSREAELEADAFAADTLVDIGEAQVLLNTGLWSALGATGSFDPALEQIASHPSGVRRMSETLSRSRSRIRAKGLPISPEIDRLIDDTEALMGRIEALLPPMPLPDGSSYVCN